MHSITSKVDFFFIYCSVLFYFFYKIKRTKLQQNFDVNCLKIKSMVHL